MSQLASQMPTSARDRHTEYLPTNHGGTLWPASQRCRRQSASRPYVATRRYGCRRLMNHAVDPEAASALQSVLQSRSRRLIRRKQECVPFLFACLLKSSVVLNRKQG